MAHQNNMFRITLLAISLTAFGVVSSKNLCPVDWAEFKGECLYFSHAGRSYVEAQRDCRAKGGYLAADDNAEKHNFIRQILSVLKNQRIEGFYLGSDDFAFEGQWRWLETGIQVQSFTAWGTSMPEGEENHNCMQLNFEGNEAIWIDQDCNQRRRYICEKQAVDFRNTTGIIGR